MMPHDPFRDEPLSEGMQQVIDETKAEIKAAFAKGNDPTHAAITAMPQAIGHMLYESGVKIDTDQVIMATTAGFHAQHGHVRVVPIEATKQMRSAAWSAPKDMIDAGNAAGDLTRPVDRPLLDDKTAGILERDFGITE